MSVTLKKLKLLDRLLAAQANDIIHIYRPGEKDYFMLVGDLINDLGYPTWSSTAAANGDYDTGTRVTYGFRLWESLTDDNAAIPTEGANWTEVSPAASLDNEGTTTSKERDNAVSYEKLLEPGTTPITGRNVTVIDAADFADGDSVTFQIMWTVKSSSDNTGAGGLFISTWTRASGTLQKVADNTMVTNNDTGDTFTLGSAEASEAIQFTFNRTGSKSYRIAYHAKIIRYKS